jgi:hypothetical protein
MCNTLLIPENGQVSLRREQFACGTTQRCVQHETGRTVVIDNGVDVPNLAVKT